MEDSFIIDKLNSESTRDYGFNLLVKAYQERVYWHTRKMVVSHDDADDLTQDIFVKVWKNLDKFRGDSSLFTWIYRIATNECLNHLQKKKRKAWLSFSSYQEILGNELMAESSLSSNEVEIKLQSALLKLPDKQRQVFNMRYFEELKFNDISDITGTSVGALKANYHHAVKKIEEFINND